MTYNSSECCRVIFGNRVHLTDLATICVSTTKQPPLEEIIASQVYGFTVYLKTRTDDRFGIVSSRQYSWGLKCDTIHSMQNSTRQSSRAT